MLKGLLNTFLLISSIALLGVLFGSSSVNAQSAYDDVINVEDSIILQSTNKEHTLDITYTYGQVIQEYCSENIKDGFNNTVSDYQIGARWAISVVKNYSYGEPTRQYFIFNSNYVSPNNYIINPTLDFIGNPLRLSSYNASLKKDIMPFKIVIQINNSGTISCGFSTNQTIAQNYEQHGSSINPFLINAPINYPPDYNGTIPPDETEPDEKIGVSIRGSVVEDVISVEWYHDPDNPPPKEAKGIYLVLHNTNFDPIPPECSNQNIQEWRHSLEAIAVFDPVPCYGFWYVQSYYTSDEQGQNIIPNTDKTSLNLRVDGGSFYFDYADVEYEDDGTIISPPLAGIAMSDCVVFIESMPWIEFNYQGCFTNIQKFIGIGSTNHIHVSRQFENITIPAHQGCGSLTKVNEWIGLDDTNNYLCPQITPEIRQYITLFAVFLLYIAIIFGWYKFMTREY